MLEPVNCNSAQEAQALINKIVALFHRGEIKVIKGSMDTSVIDMEFKVEGTTYKWSLRGVMDVQGGLSLSRI